ncbi:hypothetical protein J2Z60_001366 [Lactobacillus colini]|uniref:Transposase n=1 Tax=Lactobacillus colini TaxID=1819254 RepID=A0ABS4MFP0_9LACO|nr:hypothetical protein [Lactobacillus colini]MBP2058189.1 hypothetical protein [Lactobacillus colini]
MTEHPIVPVQYNQLPKSDLQTQSNLILSVKTQAIEFNFFKGVEHEMVNNIVEKLLHENN